MDTRHLPDAMVVESTQTETINSSRSIKKNPRREGPRKTQTARLPTQTLEDDDELDKAILVEGLPVLDGEKLAAYPDQGQLIETTNGFIRRCATGFWAEYEPFLINEAEEFNGRYFEGKLVLPHIKIGVCPSPNSKHAHYSARGDHGVLGEIIINRLIFTGDFPGVRLDDKTQNGFRKLLSDILLYVLVRHYCHTVISEPEVSYRGHGPIFTGECNRIGKDLKLDPVKYSQSKRKEDKGLKDCKDWPRNVRAIEYYEGAVYEYAKTKKEPEVDHEKLLEMEGIGPGEIVCNLLQVAKAVRNNREGWKALAHAAIFYLRGAFKNDKGQSLRQFPKSIQDPLTKKNAETQKERHALQSK